MGNQRLNVFIVDDNKLIDISLKRYLENRFGSKVKTSIFFDGESCLEKVEQNTHIVILDYFLDGENKNAKNGVEILKAIKKINPRTEVIMFTRNEDVAVTIESFQEGATDFVVKGDKALDKLLSLVSKPISEPIRIMVREFGVPKFLALLFFVFIGLANVVYCMMKLLP